MAPDLATDYLGLRLRAPLVAAASPLTLQLEQLQRLADAGIGAVVLGSLFEEGCHVGAAASGPRFLHPEQYLELVRAAKRAVPVPVIASLNAAGIGAWVHCASQLQQAGADAIELDLALWALDPDVASDRIERDYRDIVAAVRLHTDLPLAVKLGPGFTAPVALLRSLAAAGADAAVLFRRSYHPDVDLQRRRLLPHSPLSQPEDLGQVLRWLMLLQRRVPLTLAASGGIHSGSDVLKAIAAGAQVAMLCSVLLRQGVGCVAGILEDLRNGLDRLGCHSLAGLRGTVALPPGVDPALLERAHYLAWSGS